MSADLIPLHPEVSIALNSSSERFAARSISRASNVSRTCQLLATFTVTNTDDGCDGSPRQAILDANANGAAEADTIAFNIPGAEVHTIAPASDLPPISGAITIDGTASAINR